jgi:hypothetical protein
MKFKKLNKNWAADLNAPHESIIQNEDGIEVDFLLNSFPYEHIDDGEKGKIAFYDVFAYRNVASIAEEISKRQIPFKVEQIPFGDLFELLDSKWKTDFPEDKIIVDETKKSSKLRHFLFFLKDATFECLAVDYQFKYTEDINDALEIKYPKGYLNHYLALFATNIGKPSKENYRMFTDLYIQLEGKKEFIDLKSELERIKKNDDLSLYLKFANRYELEGFGMNQLKEMMKEIETFKI